mgnify:CR=1 FL=1
MSNQTLRELELRCAFQMSATDSSNLIDSPAAGKLGQNRSLLYLEEHGSLEKFRPYSLPSDDWLEKLRVHFAPQKASLESDPPPPQTDEPQTDDPIGMVDDLSSWTIL